MLDFLALSQSYNSLDELRYSPNENENGAWEDLNDLRRAKVIFGIHYSGVDPNSETLRFLLEQETLRAENDPFQGIGESLETVAWLLSLHRAPQDIPLFFRAKKANVDTHCGFDSEHIFSSGLNAVRTFLKSSAAANLCLELRTLLGDEPFDQDELEEWAKYRANYMGRDWEKNRSPISPAASKNSVSAKKPSSVWSLGRRVA